MIAHCLLVMTPSTSNNAFRQAHCLHAKCLVMYVDKRSVCVMNV